MRSIENDVMCLYFISEKPALPLTSFIRKLDYNKFLYDGYSAGWLLCCRGGPCNSSSVQDKQEMSNLKLRTA